MDLTDFYIVLPSNEISDGYPNNKTSHYFTVLPHQIHLHNAWEVALVEFCYSHSWYNIDEEDAWFITKHLSATDDDADYDDFDTYERGQISSGYYKNGFDLTRELNETFQAKTTKIEATWNEHNKKISISFTQPSRLRLSPSLTALLGFDPSTDMYLTVDEDEPRKTYVADRCLDLGIKTHNLFIYSNLVKHSYVGHYSAPVIRTVPTFEDDANKYVGVVFEAAHYIPLAVNYLNVIEIKILTATGDLVQFQSGVVLCKLHFRNRNYGL